MAKSTVQSQQAKMPSSVTTNEQAADVNRRRREANQQAYEESIQGQELPPSVVAAKEADAQRDEQTRKEADAAEQDMRETTERIASQGKES
jgi:hypothetical protein